MCQKCYANPGFSRGSDRRCAGADKYLAPGDIRCFQRLKRHGVIVDSLAAVNYDFSAVFDKAIEAKVEAEQKKLTAERDLERIKVEAEQALAKARGEAESLKAKRLEVTPELLRLKQLENESDAIKKWDGRLPHYTGGGTPFIQLNSGGSATKQ